LPYRLHHGWVHDAAGERLDEVLAAFMPGPGSYTGEDVLELQGHGGPAVLRAVLAAALACGARMAEPGSSPTARFATDAWTCPRPRPWPS
jgi:tRNA modification GTPase